MPSSAPEPARNNDATRPLANRASVVARLVTIDATRPSFVETTGHNTSPQTGASAAAAVIGSRSPAAWSTDRVDPGTLEVDRERSKIPQFDTARVVSDGYRDSPRE